MPEQTVEQLKQEVANEYLKKYKKELGRLQSLALYPIEKEVKNILSGNSSLPEKFDEIQEFSWWGKILGFISKSMATDLLKFMKEKRLEIEKRKTESELVDLKNEVVGVADNAVVDGVQSLEHQAEQEVWKRSAKAGIVTTTGIAGAGIIDNIRESKSAKNVVKEIGKENMDAVVTMTREKILKLNEEAKKGLETAKSNPRLTKRQIKNIDKAIQKFDEQMGKIGDDAVDVYNAYMKLGERMPKKVLQGIEMLDPQNAKKIAKIADQLVGKNIDEMKVVLNTHHITGVSDDALGALVKMGSNTDDFLAMTKVLSAPAKAKNVFHLVKSAFIIDIACLGFDIWVFTETLNEADLIAKVNELRAQNKKNQAWTQLAIGIASFAVELWIIITAASIGSTAWPIGTVVGLAVGAITAAAATGVDALYFDVQDFYTQNKEEYIRQPRAQLKEAILQHLHNKKEGNLSLNEKIWSPEQSIKDMSLKEAWESIFFLEAVDDEKTQTDFSLLLSYKMSGKSRKEFIWSLDADTYKTFEEQEKKLNETIALRMEYIEKYLGEGQIIAGLKSSQGMYYLSQLLSQSSFYAERKQVGKWQEQKSFKENEKEAKQELLESIPEEIQKKLENISKKDKHFLYELYYGAASYAPALQNDEDTETETEQQHNQHLKQNIQYLEKYVKALEVGNPREEQYRTNFVYGNLNYNYITAILEKDFETTGFAYQTFSSETVKTISYHNRERNNELPISDKVSQNILYRLATEFYGYTGRNDAMELMQYFSEGEGHIHGLYYKDGRYINNDRAVDQKFDLTYLEDKNLSNKEVSLQVEKIVKTILYAPIQNAQTGQIVWYSRKSMIDTPTEAIDTYLNNEFETRFKAILQDELGMRTTEKKQEIKNQISDFVKTFSKEGGYVELPYYLVISAKRAGLWDLEKTQFSMKNGKLVAVGQIHDLRAIGDLEVEKEYVEQARETFTPEEMQYINLVESAHQQVEALRSIEGRGSREDELDIPVEIEHDISQHYKDWNTLKGRLLCYDPKKVQTELGEKYKEYYEYFNSLYLGILLSLNSFTWGNDIDTMQAFQMVAANQQLFDEKGNLKKDKNGKLEMKRGWTGNWSWIEKLYTAQIIEKKYTYNKIVYEKVIGEDGEEKETAKTIAVEKTIKDLWESGDKNEAEVAKRYSNKIITALLESYLLLSNDKGKIIWMWDGRDGNTTEKGAFGGKPSDEKKFMEKFSFHLKKHVAQNPFTLSSFTLPEQYKTESELQIRSYTQRDKKSEQLSKVIQKTIEQTLPNVEWQGKRGNIKYHPEDSTLESRWKKIKVEFEGEDKIKIAGFSRGLDVQSGLWLLNFINWFYYTYTEHKEITYEYEWSRAWYRKGLVRDGTVLITGKDLKKYLTNLTDTEIDQIAGLLYST